MDRPADAALDLPVTVSFAAAPARGTPPRCRRGQLLAGWPVVARVAVITLVLTLIMTCRLLPWVTRTPGWRLPGRRWRDR